jgi:hypothetical protein
MVSARRFEGLGIDSKKTMETVAPIETREREVISTNVGMIDKKEKKPPSEH